MSQILAIYPKNEVEIFNTLDYSTTFVTTDTIFENIENETRCIIIKDKKNCEKFFKKLRDGFIMLDIVMVDCTISDNLIDNKTHLIENTQLENVLKRFFENNLHFFYDQKLDHEITTLQKLNVNILLWTEKGFYGDLAAQYLSESKNLYSFNLDGKDENHLISEISTILAQNSQTFINLYIYNFNNILTLISILEWFSTHKTPLTRAIFHIEEDDWVNDIPEDIFKTHYTLKVPPLFQRLRDLFALINTYEYKYLSQEFLDYILQNRLSEKELILLLNNSFKKDMETFVIEQ